MKYLITLLILTNISYAQSSRQSATIANPPAFIDRGECTVDMNNCTKIGSYLYAEGNHVNSPLNNPEGGYGVLTVDTGALWYITQVLKMNNGNKWFRRSYDAGLNWVGWSRDNPTAWNLSGTTIDAQGDKVSSISRTGNVGIGTGVPNANLHINYNGTLLANGLGVAIRLSSTTSVDQDWVGFGWLNENTWGIQSADVNTNREFSINPFGGNVGINNALPTEALHIRGSVANKPNILLDGIGGAGARQGLQIRPWTGMAVGTYVGYSAVDDGAASARAAIFVPNTANNGVIEAMNLVRGTGNASFAGEVRINNIRNYTTTSAAIADTTLFVGTLYSVTVSGVKQIYAK